jgi:hypothetical protein
MTTAVRNQPIKLQQGSHVIHLIEADLKKETAEFYQPFIGQIASAVQIV